MFCTLHLPLSHIFLQFPTLIMSCCSIGSSASAFPAAHCLKNSVENCVAHFEFLTPKPTSFLNVATFFFFCCRWELLLLLLWLHVKIILIVVAILIIKNHTANAPRKTFANAPKTKDLGNELQQQFACKTKKNKKITTTTDEKEVTTATQQHLWPIDFACYKFVTIQNGQKPKEKKCAENRLSHFTTIIQIITTTIRVSCWIIFTTIAISDYIYL